MSLKTKGGRALKEEVDEALRNASDGGYYESLKAMGAAGVADDLSTLNAELEDLGGSECPELVAAVQDWFAEHPTDPSAAADKGGER